MSNEHRQSPPQVSYNKYRGGNQNLKEDVSLLFYDNNYKAGYPIPIADFEEAKHLMKLLDQVNQ